MEVVRGRLTIIFLVSSRCRNQPLHWCIGGQLHNCESCNQAGKGHRWVQLLLPFQRFRAFERVSKWVLGGEEGPCQIFAHFTLPYLSLIALVQLANRKKVTVVVHQGSYKAKPGPRSPRVDSISVSVFVFIFVELDKY